MTKKKYLRKKQLAVIEDMFSGGLDEQSVLDKHKISRCVYNKWLVDEQFVEEFSRRIKGLHCQNQALIAGCAALAAAKLVALTESKNPETARKACLDIIRLGLVRDGQKTEQPSQPQSDSGREVQYLPPETASRLLAALAKEKEDG